MIRYNQQKKTARETGRHEYAQRASQRCGAAFFLEVTMTREQKRRTLELYFSRGMEMDEIAREIGEPLGAVCAALNDPKALRPYMEKSAAAKLRAQICVNEQAEEAARKQAELITLGEAAKDHAVSQRAAKDILDRAGISTQADAPREVRIIIEGMPKLGMPKSREAQSG